MMMMMVKKKRKQKTTERILAHMHANSTESTINFERAAIIHFHMLTESVSASALARTRSGLISS